MDRPLTLTPHELAAAPEPRIVSRFSCGAASAVATKLALVDYPGRVTIVNAYIAEEHTDNQRFLADCEAWWGQKCEQYRDEKYGASARVVWRKKRFLVNGQTGAPCSKALKRDVLEKISLPSDIFVLGYTCEEYDRANRFIDANNARKIVTPLIDRNLSKADCLAMLQRAGIELPVMYLLGFNNNNCIGCPKGGMGYWNKIRNRFPEVFEETCQIEEELGPKAYIFRDRKTGIRFPLRQLPPDAGTHKEPEISCSIFCELEERKMEGQKMLAEWKSSLAEMDRKQHHD